MGFEGWVGIHQARKDGGAGEAMVLTGEAEYLGRTSQEEKTAEPKAKEGGLGF